MENLLVASNVDLPSRQELADEAGLGGVFVGRVRQLLMKGHAGAGQELGVESGDAQKRETGMENPGSGAGHPVRS